MSVYVDQLIDYGETARKRRLPDTRWCHLTADTRQELHRFAARIGLRRTWFQDPVVSGKPWPAKPGSPHARMWHYDLTPGKRAAAIRAGAIEITNTEMSAVMNKEGR
ncbi:DUF4031 domain-containing protein [Nocardia arthritidis]|uniref:DUF4031 domain-containing protein n=1 Tax=Nocardia arthritidis TaxID=228602 RepID=A0A6G9YUU4_9NOCA|nr:DUF4031 domain-containing protein [Nocardia arthritidis]QIS16897.1 DUF4031 domain-containing protein [Nocardia arthritidis]